jgi:ABC-type multidrug transport system fused ATPase/permease subunit
MTILFTIHWAIGLAYFVFGLLFSLSLYFFNKYLSPKIKVVTDYINQTAKTISELYRLVFLIKNEVGETKSLKDLDNVQNLHQKSYTDAWVTGNNWMTLIRISSTVFRYLSILTGVILLFTGYIGAGAIFLIFNWSANFINSVWVMTDIQKQFITDLYGKYSPEVHEIFKQKLLSTATPISESFLNDVLKMVLEMSGAGVGSMEAPQSTIDLSQSKKVASKSNMQTVSMNELMPEINKRLKALQGN